MIKNTNQIYFKIYWYIWSIWRVVDILLTAAIQTWSKLWTPMGRQYMSWTDVKYDVFSAVIFLIHTNFLKSMHTIYCFFLTHFAEDRSIPNSSFGSFMPQILRYDKIAASIKKLNKSHRDNFNIAHKWARYYVKDMS